MWRVTYKVKWTELMNIHEWIRKVSDTNTYATEAGIIVHKAQMCVSFNSHFIQVQWVVHALDHFLPQSEIWNNWEYGSNSWPVSLQKKNKQKLSWEELGKLKCGTFDYSYDVESNNTAAIFGGFSPKPVIEVIFLRYFHYILRVI